MLTETISTNRLEIRPLAAQDAPFIFELVNSKGWLKFIGDRNVRTHENAKEYIAGIMVNPEVRYWVVKELASNSPAGVVTLIKKEYLSHPDIGFAFLPVFEGKGYAFEATRAVLELIKELPEFKTLLACTLPENTKSIRLIEKLGMKYWQEITVEKEILNLYKLENDT